MKLARETKPKPVAMTCMKTESIARARHIDIGGAWKVGRGSRRSAWCRTLRSAVPLIVIRVAAGADGAHFTLQPQRSAPEKREIPRRLALALTRHSFLHLPSTCSSQGRGGPIAQTVGANLRPYVNARNPYLHAALARLLARFVEQQRPRHQAQARSCDPLPQHCAILELQKTIFQRKSAPRQFPIPRFNTASAAPAPASPSVTFGSPGFVGRRA
jgi:hypothetical protein